MFLVSPSRSVLFGLALLSASACKESINSAKNPGAPASSAEASASADAAAASEVGASTGEVAKKPGEGANDDAVLAGVAPKPAPEGQTGKGEQPEAGAPEKGEAVEALAEGAAEKEGAPDDAQAEGPKKVLLLGDSLAATGFGVLLEKKLDAHPGVQCFRKAKSASGLARPDFFDWMDAAKRQVEFRKPDLVVVIMGGNDGQDLTPRRGGKRVRWKSEEWSAAYRARMDAFLGELVGEGREVVWLGLPKTQTRKFEEKLVLIRSLQKAAVDALDSAHYIDTTPLLSDEAGELKREVKVKGKKRRMREDDGIHFTMGGSEYFAGRVFPEVVRSLGLEADPMKE